MADENRDIEGYTNLTYGDLSSDEREIYDMVLSMAADAYKEFGTRGPSEIVPLQLGSEFFHNPAVLLAIQDAEEIVRPKTDYPFLERLLESFVLSDNLD